VAVHRRAALVAAVPPVRSNGGPHHADRQGRLSSRTSSTPQAIRCSTTRCDRDSRRSFSNHRSSASSRRSHPTDVASDEPTGGCAADARHCASVCIRTAALPSWRDRSRCWASVSTSSACARRIARPADILAGAGSGGAEGRCLSALSQMARRFRTRLGESLHRRKTLDALEKRRRRRWKR